MRQVFSILSSVRLWMVLSIVIACSNVIPAHETAVIHDVNDVRFQGDSTLMGMKVESAYAKEGAFLVETTGARYEYVPGALKIYQGLDQVERRLLATITFDRKDYFVKTTSNDDHVLLWSDRVNIGIYGDSTCILVPRQEVKVSCTGNFRPDYVGRHKGEVLLIDDLGGMEIYPQRYESGYRLTESDFSGKNWTANYTLKAGNRVMIAAFPGRPFDWEKSFRLNIVRTTGGFGKKHPFAAGEMPGDSVIERWSRFCQAIELHHPGLWQGGKPSGPYLPENEPEFKRLIQTAHKHGMKVIPYFSLYYYFIKNRNTEGFLQEIAAIVDDYGVDGVYIDGLLFDAEGHRLDDKIVNWEIIRKARQIVGSSGIIALHDTQVGSQVGTVPNIDSNCDITVNGEGVHWKSVDDPYIQYQVRKFGVSNAIGLWIRDHRPSGIADRECIDALIKMNGREWFNGFQFWKKTIPDASYRYYLERLEEQKQVYLNAGPWLKP